MSPTLGALGEGDASWEALRGGQKKQSRLSVLSMRQVSFRKLEGVSKRQQPGLSMLSMQKILVTIACFRHPIGIGLPIELNARILCSI